MIDEAYLLLRRRFFIKQHIIDLDDIVPHLCTFQFAKEKD